MTPHPLVFATDFDGTLLRSDGTLSERSARAVAAAEEAGRTVIVVTARPPRWMEPFRERVGSHGIVICGNGSFVYDAHVGRVVDSRCLSADVVLTVAERLREAMPGTAFALECADGMSAEPAFVAIPGPGGEHVRDVRRAAPLEDLVGVALPGKLLARHPGMDRGEFVARATELVTDLVHLAYSGAPGLAEMTALGVTKAASLERWCTSHGIAAADVWAFGDMPNDVPMLRWAGRGYAVAGAHPEAVAAAAYGCASNDEDGVAQVIEAALLD